METFDFVVIGSGFGGSVSAMRLTEKGYRVLVLERGKRFRDQDFAPSNWVYWKYLWAPALRAFGIMQISTLNGVMILHGAGVGGGSLGYANVLEVPSNEMFNDPSWRRFAEWKQVLESHYQTARHMLGATRNPRLGPADHVLQQVAAELGQQDTFRATDVGVYFGAEGKETPDPFFDGDGPPRTGCTYCGGCMVGCRYNAKNTLVKNYLYFAEKGGAQIRAESLVTDIRPLPEGQADGARYEVAYRRSTAWFSSAEKVVRARNVVLSAGVLGTLRLLFRCRDVTRSLPDISPRLGEMVRTNSEELMGVISRDDQQDYSQGIAITSIFKADPVTRIEPVRYPDGSSLMRLLSSPLLPEADLSMWKRWLRNLGQVLRHPLDALRAYLLPGWAQRTTILLVMQTVDNRLRLKPGRNLFTGWRRGLVVEKELQYDVPVAVDAGHRVGRMFAEKTGGILAGSIAEGMLNMPTTAHILGGCPFGENADQGVLDLHGRVHGYAGLFVVDGSIMPANPGVNPSLTITALAEYVNSFIPPKAST